MASDPGFKMASDPGSSMASDPGFKMASDTGSMSWYWNPRDEEPILSRYFQHLKFILKEMETTTQNKSMNSWAYDEQWLNPANGANNRKRKEANRRSVRFEDGFQCIEEDKEEEDAVAMDTTVTTEEPPPPQDIVKKKSFFQRSKSFRSEKPRSRFQRSRSFRASSDPDRGQSSDLNRGQSTDTDQDQSLDTSKPDQTDHRSPSRSFWSSITDITKGPSNTNTNTNTNIKPHEGFADSFKSRIGTRTKSTEGMARTKSTEDCSRKFSRVQSHRMSHIKEFWQTQQDKLNKKLGINKPEARAVHRPPQTASIENDDASMESVPGLIEAAAGGAIEGGVLSSLPGALSVKLPVSIHDVHEEVLYSGTAIWTGHRDRDGHPLVVIFGQHPAWQQEWFTSTQLAKLLLYYYSIPSSSTIITTSSSSSSSQSSSSTSTCRGLTVLVDARSVSSPRRVMGVLLTALASMAATQTGALRIVHVLGDRTAQNILLRSNANLNNVQLNLLMGVDAVFSAVERNKLPQQLGGTAHHNHQTWLHFRMKLEAFVKNCRDAAQYLVHVMSDLASLDSGPSPHSGAISALNSTHECRCRITEHEAVVQRALQSGADGEEGRKERSPVTVLREEGAEALHELTECARAAGEPVDDYRSAVLGARALFQQVQEAVVRLVKAADRRLHKLELCLQLRELEEDAAQVINWLCGEGEEQLRKHADVADNLKAIRAQQKNYDKFYFMAMSQLEKGQDLVEEAGLLGQHGEDTSGVRDLARELTARIKHFTARLDTQREHIENTAHCYHMLDKAYEWALNAMKFVSALRIEKDMTSPQLAELLHRLESYLREHPPLQADFFDTMLRLAEKLENFKLHEQCKVAHSRCLETDHLLRVRQSALRKAKHKLDLEHRSSRRPNSIHEFGMGGSLNSPTSSMSSPHYMVDSPLWESSNCSSAVGPPSSALRRRSYAGKPSSPVYSPAAAAFKEHLRDMNLSEYEEYLFSEGLITEDMSDRIVANLPKGLSNSTLRGSRESLRGSQDNLVSPDSQTQGGAEKSSSLPREMTPPTNDKSPKGGEKFMKKPSSMSWVQSTLNKHNKPHKKMMRKSASMVLPDTQHSMADAMTGVMSNNSNSNRVDKQRNIKTISMVTGSSDSLPSLPEEETNCSIPASSSSSSASSQTHQSPGGSDGTRGRCDGAGATETWSPVPVNSHLLLSARIHHQSMADIRVAEVDIKRRRTLAHIMREMIHTERDYVRSLQYVIQHYIPEILHDDVPQVLRGKRNIIFGNIEKICEFHSQSFLEALEACEANPFHVGHVFLNFETEFYLYAMYNKNKPKADALMAEYGASYFKDTQRKLGDKMDLSSYLLKPVQRMGKYALLLKQMIHELPGGSGGEEGTVTSVAGGELMQELRQAYDNIKFQLRHGNDLLAMDSLMGCDVNLAEQGMLLRQDAFLTWQGRKKTMRHAFLFEEMVVLAKTKRSSTGHDVYVYKSSIKTSDMGLTESVGGSPYRFELWFRKRTMGDPCVLQAPSTDVKAAWVKEISKLLWRQAIKNRASRMAEMARMGIGTKPCLDLKASEDNIHDRLINCNISLKGPRSRNSIAGSTVDHMKKRPHSLISLSSSSSSSSSTQSSSVLTRMLESPYEQSLRSPPHHPRSATIDSNESGIVADLPSHHSSLEDACTQTTLRRPGKDKPLPHTPLIHPPPHQNGGGGDREVYLETTTTTLALVDTAVDSTPADHGAKHLVSTNV